MTLPLNERKPIFTEIKSSHWRLKNIGICGMHFKVFGRCVQRFSTISKLLQLSSCWHNCNKLKMFFFKPIIASRCDFMPQFPPTVALHNKGRLIKVWGPCTPVHPLIQRGICYYCAQALQYKLYRSGSGVGAQWETAGGCLYTSLCDPLCLKLVDDGEHVGQSRHPVVRLVASNRAQKRNGRKN